MTETRDLVAQLGIGAEEDGRPSPKKTPDNSGSSPRILVVEDERIVALDLATTLNNLGYTIAASVSSGEAAIENAVKLRPNLVLMDIRLAGEIDGIQAAEAIRKEVDLPIIYLTAHSDEPTLARARNTGPFGYVVKPFKTTELNCAIEIALHRHEIESGLREANRALESFNYSIAHDLRSPLRGIDGFSAILIENHTSNLGPEGLDCLTRIRAGVERMRQLIDDLLHLARIARSDYCPQRVDLTEIATKIMAELQAASKNRAVHFVVQNDIIVEGDGPLLQIICDTFFEFRNSLDFRRVGTSALNSSHTYLHLTSWSLLIHQHRPALSICIVTKTTPAPLPGFEHQSSHHRIVVHVQQFLRPLPLAPHHKVIKATLPHVCFVGIYAPQTALSRIAPHSQPTPQPARKALLHSLHYYRRIAPFRFSDQQMNVLRHHYVADHHESIAPPHLLQHPQKQFAAPRIPEPGQPLVATRRDRVRVARPVVSGQTARHGSC